MENQQNHRHQQVELLDILKEFGQQYKGSYRLCLSQQKAFDAILGCRTVAMGSHSATCDSCGHKRVSYNSCRNRHCPKCQYLKQVVWVDKLQARLLPIRYFHIVFTVPEFLKRLFYLNQRQCYNLLFKASAAAIQKAAANPQFLGAQSGCLSVLHTWGQSLNYHPHIHALVPAGGLDVDGMQWLKAHKKFFVPVKALSKIYRGILVKLLVEALKAEQLTIPENDKALFKDTKDLKEKCYAGLWHVHIKKTFKGGNQVVSYLGRYTHRVAISNSRILSLDKDKVSFKWKDYRDGRWKVMSLDGVCFIRRFMQHILPAGYYKIRYFGLLASANSKTKMVECFALLGAAAIASVYEGLPMYEVLELVTGKSLSLCPCCKKGRMRVGGEAILPEHEHP